MSVPKHFVFDDEGKLTEVRGYKDEIVVERWGLVYDEEERLVGLRPLSVKEVIPQSILDKMKFWRKPKPLTQVLSIDFIGLIQYIGLIYKIKKVVTIEEILEILNIKNIESANVKTEGLDNILIDKLKVGAYTERRSTLNNNGATVSGWLDADVAKRRGKFFPRGCRGFIRNIGIYCKDAGASGGTITVYVSPNVGMGAVASGVITVPSGGVETWRIAVFDMMWNYDSLFIWVLASSADIQVGYDEGTPHDAYRSDDSGASWYYNEFRTWFRTYITGETCGDVPVSGTVNTIEIPSQSQERLYDGNTNLPTTETTIKEIFGAGVLEYLHVMVAGKTDSHKTTTRIYCDGKLSFMWEPLALNTRGYTPSTPDISLLLYEVDGLCTYHVSIKFKFLRSLKITMQATGTSGQNVDCDGLVNLIK